MGSSKLKVFVNTIPLLQEVNGNRIVSKLPSCTDCKIIWGNTKWVLNTLKDGSEQLINRSGASIDLNDENRKWFKEV